MFGVAGLRVHARVEQMGEEGREFVVALGETLLELRPRVGVRLECLRDPDEPAVVGCAGDEFAQHHGQHTLGIGGAVLAGKSFVYTAGAVAVDRRERLGQQVVLGAEVVLDPADGNSCRVRDTADADLLRSLGVDDREDRVQYVSAPLLVCGPETADRASALPHHYLFKSIVLI